MFTNFGVAFFPTRYLEKLVFSIISWKFIGFSRSVMEKDGVGPVDNKPSTKLFFFSLALLSATIQSV